MKYNKNLVSLLNLNYLKFSNRTKSYGDMDLPAINCNISVFPDYIALYHQTGLYHKTDCTAIAFFQFDEDFDGKFGLYWAIYYNDKERLAYFKGVSRMSSMLLSLIFQSLVIFTRLKITIGCLKDALLDFGSCLKLVQS